MWVTFWARVRYGTHDLLYLVDGGGPREHGFTQQHLSQDAAKAPHVYTFSVPLDRMYYFYSLVHSKQPSHFFKLACGERSRRCGYWQLLLSTADTLWTPAGSQELCTTASPRTLSVQDSRCPLGSGWEIGLSRNHTAWLHSQCPAARWMAVGNADKRNILHEDNNSLILTYSFIGHFQQILQSAVPGLTTVWKQKLYKDRKQ